MEAGIVLSFIPSQRRGIQFTYIHQPMLKLKTHSGFHELFDSDMSKSTNTVVYFIGRR